MYRSITAAYLRSDLSLCLNQVLLRNERLLIIRSGRDTAALVTMQDLEALEQAEHNSELFLNARHEAKMREWRMLREAMEGR